MVDVSGFSRRVRQRPPDSLTQFIDKLPVGLNTVVYASDHAVDAESRTFLFFQTIRTGVTFHSSFVRHTKVVVQTHKIYTRHTRVLAQATKSLR